MTATTAIAMTDTTAHPTTIRPGCPPTPLSAVAADDALILTLRFDTDSQARADGWRHDWFPPGRNHLRAHLALFHKLPGAEIAAIADALAHHTAATPPFPLAFAELVQSGAHVGVTVRAPELPALRTALADAFGPWLTAQDRQRLRPHVTVTNKGTVAQALECAAALAAEFEPWTGEAQGLDLWAYRGGPWSAVAHFAFGVGLVGKQAVGTAVPSAT